MKIRIANKDDAQDILKIYQPYVEKTTITFEIDVPTVLDMQQRIEKTLQKYPYLVACCDDHIVGYAYAGAFHEREAYQWGAELSVYVDAKYHRQGIAKAMYKELISMLKKMHIQVVYADITHPNEKSEAFHEALGFQRIAVFHHCGYKFNEWHSIMYMEKRIDDAEHPQDMIWFPEIKDDFID